MHHHGSLFSNSDLIENLNSTPTWREKNDLRIDQHRTVGLNVLEMNSNRFWDSDSSRCHIWVELVVCKLTITLYQTQKNCFYDSFVNFVMILLFFNYFKLWFIFITSKKFLNILLTLVVVYCCIFISLMTMLDETH